MLEIHTVESEVAALNLPCHYELIDKKRRPATPDECDRLRLAEDAPVLGVTCLHHAGDRPFCLEQRLINLCAAPEAEGIDLAEESPGAWLLRQVPWQLAEHAISAATANATLSHQLDIPGGTACLVVERRTWNADHVVTSVRLTYPADRHRLVARFAPTER